MPTPFSERSSSEIDAGIREARALELIAHARLLNDADLLRSAEATLAEARRELAALRHLRLADSIDQELQRLGVRGEGSARSGIGARDHWPRIAGLALRPFERLGPAFARDTPEASHRVDRLQVGPLRVDRRNTSRTEITIRVAAPSDWSKGLLALEIGEAENSLPYLAPIFGHAGGAIAILRVRSRLPRVEMAIASRPIEPAELTAEHVAAIMRSQYEIVAEAAAIWREIAQSGLVIAPVREAISEALGGD